MSLLLLLGLVALSNGYSELFLCPEIKLSSKILIEGNNITMTCDTALHPSLNSTQLEFAFYRDGRNVQEFSASDTFPLLPARAEDSGNYTCEMKTLIGTMRRSSVLYVHIIELFTTPEIRNRQASIEEDGYITLTCYTRRNTFGYPLILFTFYLNNQSLSQSRSNEYRGSTVAKVEDSGNYSCEVATASGSVRKRSGMLPIQIKNASHYDAPQLRQNETLIKEGHMMTLTCDARRNSSNSTSLRFYFYKDGKTLNNLNRYSDTYSTIFPQSGNYTCEVVSSGYMRKMSNTLYIQVEEIFETPQIKSNQLSILLGDEMILTCAVRRNPLTASINLQYLFYQDFRVVQTYSSSDTYRVASTQLRHSGNYRCEVMTTTGRVRKPSSMIDIKIIAAAELFDTPQIRKISQSEWEGEEMTLICEPKMTSAGNRTDLQFAFYRDWYNVQEFSALDTYTVARARVEDSGSYRCDVKTVTRSSTKRSNSLSVQIRGFGTPYIRLYSSTVYEGDNVTLTCYTPRVTDPTELRISFYKDGRCVQEFNASDTLRLLSVHAEDSGNYSCNVSTTTRSLMKSSNTVSFRVKGLFLYPVIKMVPDIISLGNDVTMTCVTSIMPYNSIKLEFAFYRDGQSVQNFSESPIYSIESTGAEDYGKYTCEARTPSGSVRKRSILYMQIAEQRLRVDVILAATTGPLLIILISVLLVWKCRNKRDSANSTADSADKNDDLSVTCGSTEE